MVQTAAPSRTVEEILSWYAGQNPGVLTNLYRILNHGRLAGTGKVVILPVDQGFEHGPTRSFAPNPDAYDPLYHYRLAIEAGCNAYAAPLGFLEAGAAQFAGQIPLILKLNNHDILHDEIDPLGAQTGTVADALRLGCVGVGYTIYPGTMDRRLQYEQFAEIAREAKDNGLVVVLWAYARGGDMQKDDETGLDTITYAAQIAAQLGAHIIKVKLPSAHFMDQKSKDLMDQAGIPYDTLADRVNYLMRAAFDGRRIVINSGGSAATDEAVFEQIRAIRDGGGFGSIIGRNSFQRPWDQAVTFLQTVMDILGGRVE